MRKSLSLTDNNRHLSDDRRQYLSPLAYRQCLYWAPFWIQSMCLIDLFAMNVNGVSYVQVHLMYLNDEKRHLTHEHVVMMAEPVAVAARPHSNETIVEWSMAGRSMNCWMPYVHLIYLHAYQRWPLVVVVAVVVARKCSLWISIRLDCGEICFVKQMRMKHRVLVFIDIYRKMFFNS